MCTEIPGINSSFQFIQLVLIILSSGSCSIPGTIYQDLIGDYEYFMEGQYIPAKIFTRNDTLMCDVGVGIILNLEPVNREELRFKAENDGSVFDVQFERENDGTISRFIFTAGDVVIPVEKRLSEPAERIFSVEEIREDFNQLRRTIEQTHPALYSFTDKKEFDRFFGEQFNRIDKPMTVESIYPIFAAVSAKIGCGHSVVMMPSGYWESLDGNMFPLQLKFIGNKVYVTGTFSKQDSLRIGSTIHSINGKSITGIADEMKSLISADAYSDTYRNFRLGIRFSYLFALLYGHPESFAIRYIPIGDSTSIERIVNPVSVQNLQLETGHYEPEIEIMQEQHVAILTIPGFAFYGNRDFFCSFIDDAFTRIEQEKIVKLILDVRGNTGGDPFCATHLFSYLENEPVPYFSRPYGEYFKLAQPIPLHPNHFEGELITLIDGGIFSTAGHFAALLKHYNIGTLIGEETGATYTCNDGSRSYQLRNTRVQGRIASKTFAVAVHDLPADKGIAPDQYVTPTREDINKGKDTVLEYALNRMK